MVPIEGHFCLQYTRKRTLPVYSQYFYYVYYLIPINPHCFGLVQNLSMHVSNEICMHLFTSPILKFIMCISTLSCSLSNTYTCTICMHCSCVLLSTKRWISAPFFWSWTCFQNFAIIFSFVFLLSFPLHALMIKENWVTCTVCCKGR